MPLAFLIVGIYKDIFDKIFFGFKSFYIKNWRKFCPTKELFWKIMDTTQRKNTRNKFPSYIHVLWHGPSSIISNYCPSINH